MTQSHRSTSSTSWEKNRCDTMAKSPSHGGEMGVFYLIFWRRNYPHDRGTRPNTGIRAKWMAKLPKTRFLKRTSEAIGPAAGIAGKEASLIDTYAFTWI